MSLVLQLLVLQKDQASGGKEVNAGWVAAVVLVALVVGTVLLWRNMRKQLGKIDFDEEAPEGQQQPPDRTPRGEG